MGERILQHPVFIPSLLLVLVLAAFLLGISYNYSGDDLQYAIVIEGAVSNQVFYHPAGGQSYQPQALEGPIRPAGMPINLRYLFEWPTSIGIGKLWQLRGWTNGVILPIQVLRGVVGAIGILFFFLAVNQLCRHPLIAVISSIGLAITVSYWTYSTHLDQSINMMALISASFYVLVRQYKTGFTWRGKFLLAALLALATFYNFTAVLTAFAFGIAIAIFSPNQMFSSKIRQFIQFELLYGLQVAVIVIAAIFIWVSPESRTDPDYWRSVLFAGKPEYGVSVLYDTFRAVLGVTKSLIAYPGVPGSLQDYWDSANSMARVSLLAYYGVVLAFMIAPLVFLWFRRKHWQDQRWLVAVLIIWFGIHCLFNWIWDPGFVKYWLVPLLCWWTLVALALNQVESGFRHLFRATMVGVSFLIAIMFGVNLTTQFLPDARPQNNPWVGIAQSLRESAPNALFISGGHPLDFHIAYFTGRDIVSLGLLSYDQGGDEEAINAIITEHIQQHKADGGAYFVYSLESLPPDEYQRVMEELGVEELRRSWVFPQLTIYEVMPRSSIVDAG